MKKTTIEEKQALGRVLVAQRQKQNLTQEKLTALAGVPIRTLQRAECGDGISHENLDAVALALGTNSRTLLASAARDKAGAPDLRLKMAEVTTSAELVGHLGRECGVLQIGPEGEHEFNEHLGGMLLELKDRIGRKVLDEADYALQFCRQMGFRLFACHYREELEYKGKIHRKPTTLIIAAPLSDQRINKTSKGFILDYVMDRRKQLFHRVFKGGLTVYDWMEDQLISKSYGAERVRAELVRIHQEIRAGAKSLNPSKTQTRSRH